MMPFSFIEGYDGGIDKYENRYYKNLLHNNNNE